MNLIWLASCPGMRLEEHTTLGPVLIERIPNGCYSLWDARPSVFSPCSQMRSVRLLCETLYLKALLVDLAFVSSHAEPLMQCVKLHCWSLFVMCCMLQCYAITTSCWSLPIANWPFFFFFVLFRWVFIKYSPWKAQAHCDICAVLMSTCQVLFPENMYTFSRYLYPCMKTYWSLGVSWTDV